MGDNQHARAGLRDHPGPHGGEPAAGAGKSADVDAGATG